MCCCDCCTCFCEKRRRCDNFHTPLDKLAMRVIRHEFGDGKVREVLLGDLYWPVQKRVNEILQGR